MTTPDHPNPGAPRLHVGFVVQRCGPGVNGGAESLCLQIAGQMGRYWETEILTTCALDYVTWENHYPEGVESHGRTQIRRFPVSTKRQIATFDSVSLRLNAKQRLCTMAEQAEWMRAQGPHCPALTAYLREHRDDYDAFLFFGYLYATTFDNLRLVADKAWLVPCAHDEWPINFTMFDRLFGLPRGFIFNTHAEKDFTQDRFFHLDLQGPVAGVGVEPPADVSPDRFRARHRIDGPFLLYCGRIDLSKGCGQLFEQFQQWRQDRSIPHQLVLIGNSVIPIPSHPDIISLGFLPEGDKWDAMAACDWLVMPSPYESLSFVTLETWAVGRPVLANARCAVLKDHCTRSRGGVAFDRWDEALAAVQLCSASETAQMGENGRRYVRENYTWREVCAKYRSAVQSSKLPVDLAN